MNADMCSGVNLVLNLGVVDPGKKNIFPGKFPKNFVFFCQFHKEFRFFKENFRKISIFLCNLNKSFGFLGKNCPFTATSEQIILFLFKSHHF